MKNIKLRNVCISIFVAVWLCVFFYESTRHFFLSPVAWKIFKVQRLPKLKFLFPPAGWIMFYNVGDTDGDVVVYGVKEDQLYRLDPHEVYSVRFIGFDNIYRGILGQALSPRMRQPFCQYLKRKIGYFDEFAVGYIFYPSVTKNKYQRQQHIVYRCQ